MRINGLDTPWGTDDVAAVAGMACDGVLLPKVAAPADLDRLAAQVAQPLWAMLESPFGVINAPAICAHPRLQGIVMGTNDLAKDLGSRPGHRREPMLHALGACLLAARAHHRIAIDGVFNAFHDTRRAGRRMRAGPRHGL